ncbi:MAG TPA: arginine deiminase family protein [Candidatus Krumholzibacteria bacterium]|nr:arginine deiminase family protein [Candidatus Krumholzibacteria bacterium]
MTAIAIIRPVSKSIVNCELTHLAREPIDYGTAVAQHADYEAALIRLGCDVVRVPVAHDKPDAVFIEDVAVVLDEGAVMTRPGALSRRDEGREVETVLARYRNLVRITEPGTLDGGDVLHVGKTLYVGCSGRTNHEGIAQLRTLVSNLGYDVTAIDVHGCLHLKSAVTAVGDNTFIGNSAWVDRHAFARHEWIEVDPREPFAANALSVNEGVIYPLAFTHTADLLRRHLEQRNVPLELVDASELAKAEGGVTCCSLILAR